MKTVLYISLVLLGICLFGCQSIRLAGDYYDPPMALAKHPQRLQLSSAGTYSFGQMYMPNGQSEKGRWWRIEENVVMLVPNDATKPQWFARVAKKSIPKELRYSNDVRKVLSEPGR